MMQEMINSCAQSTGTGIVLVASNQPADIRLSWGEPAQLTGYASKIGEDHISVIVHPQNPLSKISAAEVQSIYAGNTLTWDGAQLQNNPPSGEEITIWYFSTPQIMLILQSIMPSTPLADANLSPDPEEILSEVALNPASISIIPARLVDDRVKGLEISAPLNPTTIPVLAITETEPQGQARAWLACITDHFD